MVAFANGKQGAVLLPAGDKRQLVQWFRRSLIPRRVQVALWFAVMVFLLVEDVPRITTFVIDEEYTGKELVIEEALAKLLARRPKDRWVGHIQFRRIGKRSPAHMLAWVIHRGKRLRAVKRLTARDIIAHLVPY